MNRISRWAVIASVTVLVGCDDVTDIIPGETYELVEAEGQSLPAVIFEGELDPFGQATVTAVEGSITLRETTYTQRITFDVSTEAGEFPGDPTTVRGSYSANGNLLTFQPEGGHEPFTGTLSGGTLTTEEEHPDFGVVTSVWQR